VNIFVLDNDIQKCVQYTVNRHVVKMVLETAQLLCSPFEKAPYKRTHYNHPCAVWSRSSKENYKWLIEYGLALSSEYTYRYEKVHKSSEVIKWCKDNVDLLDLEDKGLTLFAQAMPEEYRHSDPVIAYRMYYIHDKQHIAHWKKRDIPWWWSA